MRTKGCCGINFKDWANGLKVESEGMVGEGSDSGDESQREAM